MTQHRFTITAKDEGKSPLAFLAGRIKGMNPNRLKVAHHKGFIGVNGNSAEAESLLKRGDTLSIDTSYFEKPRFFPEDIPLKIVYEDEAILVVHKAAGMACHAGLGTYKGTLLNALAYYFAAKGISALENGLVHRLDKASSGLMVVAKTSHAFDFLKRQVSQNKVLRSYFVATGCPMVEKAGKIEKAIGRNPENEMEIGVREDGKAAVTHYVLWKEKNGLFIYHCRTEHGRTHQVRIHFASMGCPLLGDQRYGGEQAERLHLCSAGVSFVHPISLVPLHFQLEKPDFL